MNIVHIVLDGDADKKEDNVLIDRVSEMYFKSWKIHRTLRVMLCVLLETIDLKFTR